ncbi:MAG: surface carbohydrate biosynthesis protein [Dongiaceae bacterium]
MPNNGPGPAARPFLYLPVEVAARELDAKLLITFFAVSAGYEVVLGQKWLMQRNLGRMPPGIVLFKTLTAVDAKSMRAAHAQGHRIAAIDEEIPGLIARNEGLRWVAPAAVAACDLVFAVGDEHLDALLWKFPEQRRKYAVVGNPRWDLLRPEFAGSHHPDVQRIREQYGRFILINTNLGFTNSGKGTTEQMVRKLERGGKFDRRKPEDAFFLSEHLRLERASLDGIAKLLPMLAAAFPGHRIILRPHPSENASTWKAIVAGMERVAVVRDGAALPWILAADLLIHPYCTTGVEAFALGRPAICLRPAESFVLDNYLSPLINVSARTADEVVEQARTIVAAGDGFTYPAAFQARFDRSFAAMSGAFAAERIVQRLTEHFQVGLAPDAPQALWAPGRGYARYVLSKKHNRGLMPALTAEDIRQRLTRYGEATGRARQFAIEPCGDRVFHIHGHRESARTGDGNAAWLPRWVRRLTGGASARG